MVKALGAVIGVILVIAGLVCIILSTYLATLGLQTQPILILGLIYALIGFVIIVIAGIVYLCFQSPVLVVPQG